MRHSYNYYIPFNSRVRYGIGDLKWVSVLDDVSLYVLVFFPFLVLAPVGINRSIWREFSAVRFAKVRQSFTLRGPRGSKPNCRSCCECDGSQRPVIAAMATLWALSRSLDWEVVRPGCQTGQASSRMLHLGSHSGPLLVVRGGLALLQLWPLCIIHFWNPWLKLDRMGALLTHN